MCDLNKHEHIEKFQPNFKKNTDFFLTTFNYSKECFIRQANTLKLAKKT